jgi:hypothetical protein
MGHKTEVVPGCVLACDDSGFVKVCIFIHTCVFVFVFVLVLVCVCVSVCVCLCVCMCVCT